MLPLLKIAAEGETRIPDVLDRVADQFGMTAEERESLLPSKRQKVLHNRLHWAKFYMGKAGLVESPSRGRFIATAEGRALLARNPPHIDVELLDQYPTFREFYGSSTAPTAPAKENATDTSPAAAAPAITPEEQVETAFAAMQSTLQADLLQRILQNSPAFFEAVIVSLLVAMGYGGSRATAAQQLGRSGDGGVDGVINEDHLGLDRVYVQAKRYAPSNSIGRPDVQAFVGSLVGLGASKGVFVTTSSFSSQAIDFVRHLSQRIILIDGKRLTDLMIEHNVGVRIARTVEYKRIDEDFFSEEE
jgi:restriction system protein